MLLEVNYKAYVLEEFHELIVVYRDETNYAHSVKLDARKYPIRQEGIKEGCRILGIKYNPQIKYKSIPKAAILNN